jgi:chromosome segregation ATPase
MREEYEEKSFNPLKFGVLAAAIVAVIVTFLLYFNSYRENRDQQALEKSALQDEIAKLKKDKTELESKLEALDKESKSNAESLEKQLKSRDSQISNVKREKESDSKAADAKIAQIKKEKEQVASELAQLKKDFDDLSGEKKKALDQVTKLQNDIKMARQEADRNAKEMKVMRDKLNKIDEGDRAAADAMVEQLAEARQELKSERAARQRLEQELTQLRGQQPPQ